MQGDNFILPDRERVPSVTEALVLYFFACAGRIMASYLGSFVTLVCSYFIYGITDTFADALTSIIYYMVFIVLPVSLVAGRNRGISEYVRIRPLPGTQPLWCVLAACVGVLFVTYLSYLWIIPIQALGGILSDSTTVPATAGAMMLSVFTEAVLPGICEELLFRGMILAAYDERGSVKSILITAFLFMCMHGSVAGMASEFVSGLILGFIVVSTDSLFAGMIYHTVHNAVLLLLTYAEGNEAGTTGNAVSIYDSIGGMVGLIQIILMTVLFGLLMYVILRRIDNFRKDRNFGPAPGGRRERGWQELIVLGSCVAVVLLFYGLDVLGLMGVLK